MKTTVAIPDKMFRELKTRSALAGRPMRTFVIEAIEERLYRTATTVSATGKGWRAVFGKASRTAVADVQAVIDREFSYAVRT